jgi:hypothetical protein
VEVKSFLYEITKNRVFVNFRYAGKITKGLYRTLGRKYSCAFPPMVLGRVYV